ncbi:uncharacterized protein BXZ73DRAFT_111253 [Epithele typhae]|uniref:uncharacterized protein n=1 Tax=Epithele typhae TaxID=378194 RepID=UPI0020073E9B|nr:uncharacterized protein BXZ73DRAFT_111253 [Epithele typhae]KAH9904244.1 hypothetical protein BXZ73DRAFT_111253 [Epithele typhae]
MAVFARRPQDPDWMSKVVPSATELFEVLEKIMSIRLGNTSVEHRRGQYPQFTLGTTFGGGQQGPQPFATHDLDDPVIEMILDSVVLHRLSGNAGRVFQTFAPDLHGHYCSMLHDLHKSKPDLPHPWKASPFSAATLNVGRQTITYRHRDFQNLAYGWCSLYAFGKFDHKRGGHLILWDLGVIVEIPPGCLALLPSAVLEHSNTTIGKDETRHSFTEFTSGHLFRWVDNKCRTDVQMEKDGDARSRSGSQNWRFGLELFSTFEAWCARLSQVIS